MRDYTRFLGSLERPDTTSDKFSLFYLWLWSKTAHNLQTLWSGLDCKKALMTGFWIVFVSVAMWDDPEQHCIYHPPRSHIWDFVSFSCASGKDGGEGLEVGEWAVWKGERADWVKSKCPFARRMAGKLWMPHYNIFSLM